MYCQKCGAENSEQAKFCKRCGAALIAGFNVPGDLPSSAPKKKKSHKAAVVAASLVLLAGVGGGAFVFRDKIMQLFSGQKQEEVSEKKFDEDNIGEVYFQQIDTEHIADDESGVMYADNEILLVADEGVSYEQVEELAEEYDAKIVGWIEQTGDYQLELSEDYTMEELEKTAADMESEKIIDSACINYISEVSEDSVNYGKEWSGETWDENEHAGSNWGVEAVHALSAWNILDEHETDVNPVRVGLIDGGFDTGHEDLGFAEVFYNTSVSDHGTHVAGTMAARVDNKEGICGVYPYGNGNMYGVAYGVTDYSENGDFFSSTMIQKISYSELILRNVKVINQSQGFNYYSNMFGTYDKSGNLIKIDYKGLANYFNTNSFDAQKKYAEVLADLLNRFLEKGYDFVIVSAAGNDSDASIGHLESKYSSWNNIIDRDKYPDVYDRIIVVGSVGEERYSKNNAANILYDGTINISTGDSGYHISGFSNIGKRADVFAPGEGIFSSVINDRYAKMDGTSMASPHVAGIAAMVWAADNDLKGNEVKKIVCDTANNLVTIGNDGSEYHKTDYKLVNAKSAVEAALGIDTETDTSEAPENGGILCWVVNKDNEDEKIKDAVITAVNADTNETESTTTDEQGHFEIILPEGTYILTVEAEGYETYTSGEIKVKNEGVNYLDDWIKLKSAALSEDDLKELVQINGTIYDWEYHDYDENGSYEAYAILNGFEGNYYSIYFIDSNGKVTCMLGNLSSYFSDNDNGGKYSAMDNKGFFSFDMSAGGSGYRTYLYSVKNNIPYELEISGDLQGFFKDESKQSFYTTANDFSNGYHEYPEYELIYDDVSQQFSLGERIEEEEYPLFTGIVNTEKDSLNVRKSPSKTAEIIGKLDKGTYVDVYSEENGWCEIRYEGKTGYVSKEFINCEVGGYAKPVIYLYPEEKTDVSVKVRFKNGKFTCTYPEYKNGWNVTAYPDGKIVNKADNDEYSYLYWEGEGEMKYDFDTGFVVKREDTAEFLKEKLSYMGLTAREYNEFIVYWLPIMQKNEYNLISFQTDNYDESAKLDIMPAPDSVIRVFMAFRKADPETVVKEQKLEKFERKGFAVVEWGGTEVESNISQ